jgi:hypothetical protein
MKANAKQSLPRGVYKRTVSGSTYFQVSLGRDGEGKQKWKSCKTLDEAITQRQLFVQTKQQQGESLWLLNAEQRADAVAALEVLKAYPGETLVAAVNHYQKTHLSLLNRNETIEQLIDKWIGEQVSHGLKQRTIQDLRSRLNPFKAAFGNRLASEVTVEDVKAWDGELIKQGLGQTSRHHYIAKASSFYRWAVANRFADRSPLDPAAVRRPKIVRGNIKFLTVDQCKTVLRVFKKHGLLNYAVLGLLCGIRPEETRRLHSSHFLVDGETIVKR